MGEIQLAVGMSGSSRVILGLQNDILANVSTYKDVTNGVCNRNIYIYA